ncbi:MAG: peptidoglycan editing factor PgeF [Desulfuromonadales bacterium]|nr:peptidoglycan editing factor PgeF [Desulfuromonadales bacterium]
MKIARQGKINYLQPDWADSKTIQAGFTTRNGGVSRAPYNSLNLGLNTEDHRANVEGNRSTVVRAFDLQPHMLLTVQQSHGNNILVINEPNHDLSHFQSVECDAIVTNQPGIMLGILVADCYPVLLFDPIQRVAAVVHVGWRGAANGILPKTIACLFNDFSVNPADLKAAIGPGIGAHRYEVDRPVRDAFRSGTDNWSQIAKETELGKWHLDLRRACELQLAAAGLPSAQVDVVEEDTCCHRELFFSFRRDNGQTGRQMGFVLIPEE